MKKYIAAVLIVLGIVAWMRVGDDPDSAQTRPEPARPSPVDEEIRRPAPRIQAESVRTRLAEVSTKPQESRTSATLSGTDWAVVAAIYKEYETAQRRARKVMDSTSFDPTVFPAKGQGSKYMVVVDSGLTHAKATEIRERALAAGLPADTYVTRLTAGQ
jgi:hypothetical protein